MTLKKLLFKNKVQLSWYMIGAFLTPISDLFFTFALSNAFGIMEETSPSGVYRRIAIVAVFALTPVVVQVVSRLLRIGLMRDVLIQVRTLAYEKIMNYTVED